MNNVYREAFVFDCALADRKFYLPQNGAMKLQFFHVRDMCRFMDILLDKKPVQHIFNVGNKEAISIREWVELCYRIAGKEAEMVCVGKAIEQRSYFSFYDYEYVLDISLQNEWMKDTVPLEQGFREAFDWYVKNQDIVNRKPFMEYIDKNLARSEA